MNLTRATKWGIAVSILGQIYLGIRVFSDTGSWLAFPIMLACGIVGIGLVLVLWPLIEKIFRFKDRT